MQESSERSRQANSCHDEVLAVLVAAGVVVALLLMLLLAVMMLMMVVVMLMTMVIIVPTITQKSCDPKPKPAHDIDSSH